MIATRGMSQRFMYSSHGVMAARGMLRPRLAPTRPDDALRSLADARPTGSCRIRRHSDLRERSVQIGDEIVRILDAHRHAQRAVGDAKTRALVGRDAAVRGD